MGRHSADADTVCRDGSFHCDCHWVEMQAWNEKIHLSFFNLSLKASQISNHSRDFIWTLSDLLSLKRVGLFLANMNSFFLFHFESLFPVPSCLIFALSSLIKRRQASFSCCLDLSPGTIFISHSVSANHSLYHQFLLPSLPIHELPWTTLGKENLNRNVIFERWCTFSIFF